VAAATVVVPLIAAAPGLIKGGIEVAKFVKESRQEKQAREAAKPSPKVSREVGVSRKGQAVSGVPKLDQEQRTALEAIAREVAAYPLPPALASSRDALTLAFVINAWVESRLRPGARNDAGEESIGLFQINRRAHPRYPAARLIDPAYNTRAFLELLTSQAAPFERALRRGATIAELTAGVTYYVERPKDRAEKAEARAGLARDWYGSLADRQALGWRA
jgi:hypothetical protein